MGKSLLDVFQTHMGHVKPNTALIKALYHYQVEFVNKKQQHMEFFAGNLTGVQIVRFTERDFSIFFDDILDVDRDALRRGVREIDDIKENYKVASDVFNLTCIYLIHILLTSPHLTTTQRERGALDVGLLFHYRCISALLNHYFRYPIDKKTAEATYAALSQRYLIKQLGSWLKVMEYRAIAFVGPDSLHRKTFETLTNDYAVVQAINDGQGRVRDMLKNIYAEFIRIHRSGGRFGTTQTVLIDTDGEAILKDRVHGLAIYTTYLRAILPDKNAFIKEELIDVVADLIYTAQRKLLIECLTWLSDEAFGKEASAVDAFITAVMLHSYDYFSTHRAVLRKNQDLAGLLSQLRGVYTSSRSSDPILLSLRTQGASLVTAALGSINEQQVASIRTAVFLYLIVRTYSKNFYSKA